METLWRAGRSSDSAINLAAIVTMYTASMSQGREELSLELLVERLCLHVVPHTDQHINRFRRLSPTTLRALSHTA